MELDMKIEHPPHHHHTSILLNPHIIPHLLPLNQMSLKLLKLRDLKCQTLRKNLIRLNLHWHKEVRLKLEHRSLDILIYILNTIIIGMLHNTMHINMLHKPIIIHIVIANVYHILWLKRVIESTYHINIKGMFHMLEIHILLE